MIIERAFDRLRDFAGEMFNVGVIRFVLVAALSVLQMGAGVAYIESTEQGGSQPTVPVAIAPLSDPEPKNLAPGSREEDSPVAEIQPAAVAHTRSIALTIVAIASPFVTLLIGALTIVSKHRITEHQLDLESAHDNKAQEIDARKKALEVRLALLERGIPCEHADCPVVQISTGQRPWDVLPPFTAHPSSPNALIRCGGLTASRVPEMPESSGSGSV